MTLQKCLASKYRLSHMVLLKMDAGGSRVAHPVKQDREIVGCWRNMGSAHREGADPSRRGRTCWWRDGRQNAGAGPVNASRHHGSSVKRLTES
jgi:hypothetical protein